MWIFHDLSTSEIDWAKQCTFLAWCVLTFESIFLQHCPISAFGLQRRERDR